MILKTDQRQKKSDHTQVTPLTMEYLEELKKEENKRRRELEKQEKKKVENPVVKYQEDSTQMIDIKSLQKNLALEAKRTENQLEEKEEDLLRIKKLEEEEIRLEEKNIGQKEKSKRKIFNLVGVTFAALALGYAFFVPNDKEIQRNRRVMVWPEIKYPIANDIEDVENSEKHYKKAIKLLEEGNYTAQVKACLLYTSPSPRDRG